MRYSFKKHGSQVKGWLIKRNLPTLDVHSLPKIGVIVDGVAAGFLRRVEGGCGMIDSFVSNPDAPAQERDEALNFILSELVKIGQALEITKFFAFSVDKNTIIRGHHHAFESVPYTLLVLDLSRKD